MLRGKIVNFDEFDEELEKLNQEKLECIKRINNIDNLMYRKKEERRDFGLNAFRDKEYRKKLLNEALECGYSEEKINELASYIDKWNQDNVTNDVLDSFRMIQQYVNEYRVDYQNGIFYKISRFLEGGNENEN